MQELTVPSYVANDTVLVGGPGDTMLDGGPGDNIIGPADDISRDGLRNTARTSSALNPVEGPSTMIMTGPNYSGKSVYLKQIALIVYMAHVGCFVPADAATIGLTDKILTRIATRETVSKIQSAFVIDLQQIALAATLTTHRSLVIIDEFGKGTEASGKIGARW